MEEQLITFETAKLAKEKGFKSDNPTTEYVPAFLIHEFEGFHYLGEIQEEDYNREDFYLAPTQSLLQKWFRDIHNINISIEYESIGSDDYEYCYTIKYEEGNAKRQCNRIKIIESLQFYPGGYINVAADTYEEVLEFALQKALNLIKC